MKPLLLFFVFFISLSSFMAGWILKGKYQVENFKNYQKASQQNLKKQTMETPKQNLKNPAASSDSANSTSSKPKTSLTETIKKTEKTPDITGTKKQVPVKPPKQSLDKANSAVEPKKSLSYNAPKPKTEKAKQKKYHSFNNQAFLKIKGRQAFFTSEGKYSFLINVFSQEKPALEHIKNLKNRFPLWSFFIKPDRNHLRVYLGPFQSKKEALDFIKNIPSPTPFPNYFLEEESISSNEL